MDYAAKKARDFFSRLPDGVAAEGHVAALIRDVLSDCTREAEQIPAFVEVAKRFRALLWTTPETPR